MSVIPASPKPLQILMMPDYRIDNPYQDLLAQALQQQQVEVRFPVGYRRVLPILRAIKDNPASTNILHLHWLSPYLKGDRWLIKFIYCTKFLLDILLTRLTGVRVVWTIHNYISHDARFPRLEHWTQWVLVRLSDGVIVHQQAIVQEIAQTYNIESAKIAAIPHGHYRQVYGDTINPVDARKTLGLPETGKVFLNLGMLRPYKGIERLIQLWQDHPEILTEHTLLIAGQPADETYELQLKKQATGLENIVLHTKFIENSQISLYFSAADVVILPFKRVLTSGSLILSMSYGKPVIAPQLNTLVETLEAATYLLYDPDDNQGLLYMVKKSLQADLQALQTSVIEACDQLNWDSIGQKTKQLYQATL